MFDIEGKMICLPIFDTNLVYERWGGVNVAIRIEWKMGGRGLDKFKNKEGDERKDKKIKQSNFMIIRVLN